MPAKKNAGSKRGKNAAAKMKTTMPEPEDVAGASELKVFEKDALDSTFVINKDAGEDVSNGTAKITTIDDGDGVADEMGNGDAQDSLDKIEEETDETDELKTISKKKGRAKATVKKEKLGEPEFAADEHQENDEPGSSPKRPLDESFNEETAVEEPPTKRGREKGGKKAQAASKKTRKTKNEPLPVANDADEVESFPEEAATEEPVLTKSGARARKGRKAKEEEEEEGEESEGKVSKEKPAAAMKKGRPVTKAGSPETNNSENSVEDVAVAREKTTKKRAAKEKVTVPVPSTRPTRTRKPISYGETADEAENMAANKKPKKAASKKAALLTENATKAGAGTKRRGRVAKEASDEAAEEE